LKAVAVTEALSVEASTRRRRKVNHRRKNGWRRCEALTDEARFYDEKRGAQGRYPAACFSEAIAHWHAIAAAEAMTMSAATTLQLRHDGGQTPLGLHMRGRGTRILQQACWDFHSPGGCTRGSCCNWVHCPLDQWQTCWLRLQRFLFGGQLGTFDDLAELAEAVTVVFSDEARLATDVPPDAAASQAAALAALEELGYPFNLRKERPATDQGGLSEKIGAEEAGGSTASAGCHAERRLLLASVRELASAAIPGSEVLPVGSFAWGVDTDGSDLDVVVLPAGACGSQNDLLDRLLETLERLQASNAAPRGLQEVESALYGRTNVPVLTMRAEVNDQLLGIDVCAFGQLGSVRDAILFRHAVATDPSLQTVLQLLKRWLRTRAVPSCREGGYPQVFWMRLAARTYQATSASDSWPKMTEAERRPEGSEEPSDSQVPASRAANEDGESEARWRLRSLCARWSTALPTWGEPLSLTGEDPCVSVKRLATGVFGATALLCMHELRSLAASPRVEDLPPVSPRMHLCPSEAGFWAVFLLPGPGADGSRGSSAELVPAWVGHCAGDTESVRQSSFVPSGPGCNAMLHPPGRPDASDSRLACVYKYVSRRDTDWVFWATEAIEAATSTESAEASKAGREVAEVDAGGGCTPSETPGGGVAAAPVAEPERDEVTLKTEEGAEVAMEESEQQLQPESPARASEPAREGSLLRPRPAHVAPSLDESSNKAWPDAALPAALRKAKVKARLESMQVEEASEEQEVADQRPRLQAVPVVAGHTGRQLALNPPHFVCLLEGNPALSEEAQATLLRLRELFAEPQVAASLPPAYPLHRYSRRLLLKCRPKVLE